MYSYEQRATFLGLSVSEALHTKFVGVTLNRALTFRLHFADMSSTVKNRLNIIKAVLSKTFCLSQEFLTDIYGQIVRLMVT